MAGSFGLLAVLALAACTDHYSGSSASLIIAADGTQTVSFGLGRCMGPSPYELDVEERDDEVRIGVDGAWSDGDDCSFVDEVVLSAPLGDRELVLTGPGDRYRACEEGPGAGSDAPVGGQSLCTGDETVADFGPVYVESPMEGVWVSDGASPPVWMRLQITDETGSFVLVGSAGCNELVIEVPADGGGEWGEPSWSATERGCGGPAAEAEEAARPRAGSVSISELGQRVRFGDGAAAVEFRAVGGGDLTTDAGAPVDAAERGAVETGRIATGVELPSSAACWYLGHWVGYGYVGLAVLVDGAVFGAPDSSVAFENDELARLAGAECGERSEDGQRIGLPGGLGVPGAYEVCDRQTDHATCYRFVVRE